MDIDASSPFSRAFDYASDCTGRRFQNPVYPLTELFNGARFKQDLSEVKSFGRRIVDNAKNRQSARVSHSDASKLGSLIDALMDAFDGEPTLTADAALNFLSAGRDTTAQSLTWTFYSLFRNPSVVEFLREDIDAIAATESTTGSRHPHLSISDLQPASLPRTMAIFNESLRLYPPVPFEIKQCQTDVVLPDKTFLPKGSIIVWCIWAMNRAHEIWGDDSATFNHGRWLEVNKNLDVESRSSIGKPVTAFKVKCKSAFEFPVFNGGPRACLGRKMAELIACWVLVTIWHEFDLEEATDAELSSTAKQECRDTLNRREERRSQNSLTLPMAGGLPCRVRRRWKT